MINKNFLFLLMITLAFSISSLNAQVSSIDDVIGRDAPNTITTTVPFLLIAPDTRAGGLGDAGVATTPDVNSQHWNAAKYSFIQNDFGVAISYSPWLRELVKDMNLAYLAAYKRINKENVLSLSLLYFDLGSIQFRSSDNVPLQTYNPHEFSLDFAYSRLLGRKFSGAVALRFIYSNLTGGQMVNDVKSNPGMSVAADVSFYYYNDELNTGNIPSTIMWGLNISNLGNKISYTTNEYRDFIPSNFRTGIGYMLKLDDHNEIMITCDFNKLLVPTPPIYDDDGNIIAGKDPNISMAGAIFSSWWDAPGVNSPFSKNGKKSVLREELAEITIGGGIEYWYSRQFALRVGYFNEHAYKGNRKYVTFGAGLKMNVFGLDFSYLLPTTQSNPLQNTMRFTLTFDIGGLSTENNRNKI
ncbi:MAG: type IX secretion system outer membrane channel protein PorV [Bacteroidales bacterium]|jgi:hypothetical protein|nr:type IX secretion system outer membrane channel protein PorV [Bacteroidales bacterium]